MLPAITENTENLLCLCAHSGTASSRCPDSRLSEAASTLNLKQSAHLKDVTISIYNRKTEGQRDKKLVPGTKEDRVGPYPFPAWM